MAAADSSNAKALDANQVLDGYFIENRAKLLDLAGFMDRFARGSGGQTAETDVRWKAITGAIRILGDGQSDRAKRLLELWSDPTLEPVAKAGMKGAIGAWNGGSGGSAPHGKSSDASR